MTEEQPTVPTYDEQTQQLLNAGRMAMVEKNFMVILAHVIDVLPDKRVEIPLNVADKVQINLRFDFAPDKLVIFKGEEVPESIIQLANQIPKDGKLQTQLKRDH